MQKQNEQTPAAEKEESLPHSKTSDGYEELKEYDENGFPIYDSIEDFVDLTEAYNNLFPQNDEGKNTDSYIDDVWKNINAVAGKKILKTSNDELHIGIVDTKDKKKTCNFRRQAT